MAALVGGHAYGLSSHDKNSKSKTLIFVKLTDSALKSIEEYVKDPSKSVLKPTIQFKANNGLIRLTCGDSHVKSYGFNLSNVETDGPQGSFECEQERGSRSLESLGSMHVRMNINASEDSYEKTRVKMAAVEKENKKFCTKEIKPSGPYVGRKVKLKPSISSIPPKTSSPLYITPPQKSSSKLYTNSVSMSANNLSSSINSARQINGNRIAKHASTVQSQSCRSRIIHLLAAKPYNASELILKLTNEGIKEGEKKNINAILKQVAVLKDKEHSYTLTNEAWDEVQLDWKFYSQEDIENVRRRKLLHLKSRSESRVPSPTNVLSNNSPNQKRALSEWEVNNTDNRFKKQRISHLNRQSNNIPNNVANSSRAENSNQTNGEKLLANSYSMKKEVNGHVPNSCSVKKEMNGHAQNSCSAKKEMNGHAQISYSVKKEMNGHVTNSCSAKKEVNDRVQMSESNASQKYSSHLDSSFRMNGMHGKQDDNEKMDARKTPNQKLQNEAVHQNEETRQPHWLNSNYKNHKVSDPMQKAPSTNYAVEKTKESHRRSPVEKISRRVEEHDPVHHVKMNGVSQPKSYHSLDSNLLHATNTKQNIVSDSKKLSNGHHNGYVNGYSGINHGPPIAANTKDVREADSTDCFHFDEQKYDTDPSEYYSQYPRINSKEQRARYKRDFNSDYEEYKILHDQMKRIANRFVELENKLKLSQLQDNTLDYYETQREIIEEYTDPFCFDGRKKLNYLHGKLSHIKKLVMEYDRSQVTSS